MNRVLPQKESGAYYTPDPVARSLVQWAVRAPAERLLDPSCGDGRFVAAHRNSVGIEQDPLAAGEASARARGAHIKQGDFFSWAESVTERFDCAAGNPPFIRYQTFKGDVRARALSMCAGIGAHFSGLTSSWAPFLVVTASLLRHGGRMAFVVPAEIGHAPYAAPLLEYLAAHFAVVHVVAVRDKIFPELSEDCWLLYCEGYGEETHEFRFTALASFGGMQTPPGEFTRVPVADWRTDWNRRLRPYLLSPEFRNYYSAIAGCRDSRRLGDIASIGIGYVSGANDFFHLRPTEADRLGIPAGFLHPTVRNGRALSARRLTAATVEHWRRNDDPILLLRIPKGIEVPHTVRRYLDSEAGQVAREAYKCRMRQPWYSVPDVQVPDYFLSYMIGLESSLVRNEAGCTCTNSVHRVRVRDEEGQRRIEQAWGLPFTGLSCELEGHPLGGGMLKLEPGEAAQIVLPSAEALQILNGPMIDEATTIMRKWRHYGDETQ
jgi:adenine-specific DNA methylase